jgi:predicted DNA-binding protein (MmcQ/YjbR family)
MDADRLQEKARQVAQELPAAALEHPFGPEAEVFKVRGKVFMMLGDMPDLPGVTVKVDPGEGEALRQAHADIAPGYHTDKRHWVTIGGGGSVDAALVEELVVESYRLVVAGLPVSRRPVDPATFRPRNPKPSS